MANLKLKNPSGGSLNLVSADGASDLTVTFPAATGTAMIGSGVGAWTAYTPTVSSAGGSFTTASASGSYQLIGKLCIVSLTVNITTVGESASGAILATLPFTSAGRIQIGGYGMEVNSTGNMLKGYIPSSSTQLQITTYSNGSTIGAGYQTILTVVYETA
jgi:hypothetical protein